MCLNVIGFSLCVCWDFLYPSSSRFHMSSEGIHSPFLTSAVCSAGTPQSTIVSLCFTLWEAPLFPLCVRAHQPIQTGGSDCLLQVYFIVSCSSVNSLHIQYLELELASHTCGSSIHQSSLLPVSPGAPYYLICASVYVVDALLLLSLRSGYYANSNNLKPNAVTKSWAVIVAGTLYIFVLILPKQRGDCVWFAVMFVQ